MKNFIIFLLFYDLLLIWTFDDVSEFYFYIKNEILIHAYFFQMASQCFFYHNLLNNPSSVYWFEKYCFYNILIPIYIWNYMLVL